MRYSIGPHIYTPHSHAWYAVRSHFNAQRYKKIIISTNICRFKIFSLFLRSPIPLNLKFSIFNLVMKKAKIMALLEEYLDAPEAWSDNVMIAVEPASGDARLCDVEDADLDSSAIDYWQVMDLLRMSVENPGEWDIDPEAVDELIASYEE